MLVEGGVPGSGGAQRPSPHKRAAGEENFGPEKPKQINKNRRRSPQSSPAGEARRLRALGLLVGLSAASCCSCWLGCYYQLGSSHDAVHLARTTVHQLQESWSDALVKVFAVRLAVLLVTLGLPPRSGGLW